MTASTSTSTIASAVSMLSDAVRLNERRVSHADLGVIDELDAVLSDVAELAQTARAAVEAEEKARRGEVDRLTAAFHERAHEPGSVEAEGVGCASCRRCAVVAWRMLAAPEAAT